MLMFENILLKGDTEDNVCSLPHLLYKFSWRYYIWKYLEKPVSPTVVLYAAKNLNYHTPNSCKCSYGSQWVSLAAACSFIKSQFLIQEMWESLSVAQDWSAFQSYNLIGWVNLLWLIIFRVLFGQQYICGIVVHIILTNGIRASSSVLQLTQEFESGSYELSRSTLESCS